MMTFVFRIEHQKEEKGDVKPELPFSVASITDDQDIPTSLILPKAARHLKKKFPVYKKNPVLMV